MTQGALPRTALARPRRRRAKVAAARTPWRSRGWWRWAKRGLSALFFALVAALLFNYASHIDWGDVADSVRDLPRPALLTAIGLAAASHLLYSCFDLLGRRYTGHLLATRAVMAVNFVSYAFNLCIGSLVGGVGFRYRLYSRLGLKTGTITRIVSMSMLTNWLGYMLLAGFLFLVHPLALPPAWQMGNHGLQWVGAGLMAVSLGYILACWRFGDHSWTVRGHDLYLPRWRMAVLQMAISCLNWSLMAAIIYVLLLQKVAYTDVLTVLLVGAIAGVVLHVPAGLGVFEAVFLGLLGHRVPEGQLLAALLGYRALYYIGPLAIAALMVLAMELRARKRRHMHHALHPGRSAGAVAYPR
ncbi:MAG TPA: lysylphosphatidylglycerol synthase domain-containing protein [Ramlibacter sp.]|nr:lysylphosphatidylglycerol synthase domain-containing protein [Ramlibacter sp.]